MLEDQLPRGSPLGDIEHEPFVNSLHGSHEEITMLGRYNEAVMYR
jgi:hypothetical protein